MIVCLVIDLAIVGPNRLVHAARARRHSPDHPGAAVAQLAAVWNILLLVFNLIPAYPLDGGRIARSIVWRVTGDKVRGTRVAAKMGQGFALILAGVGLWLLLTY